MNVLNATRAIRDCQLGMGNVYYEQKLYTQALPYYAEAARLDPKWALPRVYQGDTYRLLKNYPEAKSWYLQALKIDPKDEDANYWLGLLYVVEGDLVSARKHYNVLKTVNPEMAAKLLGFIEPEPNPQ